MSVRTGQQYIAGIQSKREVWVNGTLVENVTAYAPFRATIQSIAALYDLQHDPAHRDILTYACEETGDRCARAFAPPYTPDDLALRRRAFQIYAESSFGMLGRSPDFLNSAVMAYATAAGFFGGEGERFSANIKRYYRYCRENDLFLSHATIPPQVDRSKAASEQDDAFSYLRVVKETADGIIVRGAKMIGTLAPVADELLVFNMPGLRPGDEPYAMFFAIPISTPGLRLICREPVNLNERTAFDSPLGVRFDEVDATCVFDDVFVPWDRVFLLKNVELSNALYDVTNARHHTGHQGVTRGLAKAELLTAIALQVAEVSKTNTFLHVQEMLGDILSSLELVKGAILLAESTARISRWGTLCPSITPILSLRYHFPKIYRRMLEVVQTLGAGGLFSLPMSSDFSSPIADDVERYHRGAGVSGLEKTRLMKLAWDATGSYFGQRQMLYEQYHSGDPVRLAANQFLQSDKARFNQLVKRALGT